MITTTLRQFADVIEYRNTVHRNLLRCAEAYISAPGHDTAEAAKALLDAIETSRIVLAQGEG